MEVPKKSQKTSKRKPKNLPATPQADVDAFVYEFGPFVLDEKEQLLTRNGNAVPLTPKVFDILLLLVQNSGSLVSKQSLLGKIWPDAFVEEANLNVNVATLRKALGERPTEHHFIETIPKRGYRFVANVVKLKVGCDSRHCISTKPDSKPAETNRKRKSKVFNSLAVLPFYNESSDPNAEYLSDGLTESIINSLSHLKDLRIIGHNSVFRYIGKEHDGRVVGKELRVKLVVTGRILLLGETLIVRAELIDVQTGWHIWGEQYHRKFSDVLKVEKEVSQKISSALKHRLTREEKVDVSSSSTENAEAHKAYLKGRYHWSKFDLISSKKAAEYFLQAIEIDPTYALAYAGLADAYYRLANVYAPTREAMPKARAAAMKALEIDDTLSEAHAAMGIIKMFYEWDWSGAEKEFNRAIESNHNNAIAHQRFGLYFNLLGRFDEATRELELAMLIDPLSPHSYWSITLTYFLTRQYEKTIEEVQRTLEMEHDYKPALYLLGRTYEQCGQLDQALEVFKRILALSNVPMFLGALGHSYARSGEHEKARRVLKDLQEQSKERYVSAYSQAIIHQALGEEDQTFLCLEKACEDRCEMMTWLKIDPDFESVQNDLRFTNLLRRVGLSN
ncbi:MAG TPA: winged helix-turn-helix domain-containing protein [Pyrinomonadaceae bacterium]|nr:winged helix-turn-helix domain-containing protein [Pyrinomonadaceae bacterium]